MARLGPKVLVSRTASSVTLIVFPVVLGLLCDQTCLSYHPHQNVKKIEPSHQCFYVDSSLAGKGFEPAGSGTRPRRHRSSIKADNALRPSGQTQERFRIGISACFAGQKSGRAKGVTVSESHRASGTDIDSANFSKPSE